MRTTLLPVALAYVASVQGSSEFQCNGENETNDYVAKSRYLGCWTDQFVIRTLGDLSLPAGGFNSPQYCSNLCGFAGYRYASVGYQTLCMCGNTIDSSSSKVDDGMSGSKCSTSCLGDPSQSCGANFYIDLYEVLNPKSVTVPAYNTPACQTYPLCSWGICDTSLGIPDRIASLLRSMTLEEKILNTLNEAGGVYRMGLPPYEWWNEALHGLAYSPGVNFKPPNASDFNYVTSFPMPILMSAAFDDDLIHQVAGVIGKEARAFANYRRAGLDFWTPNINPFKDPRWGRGQEVPGEDAFHCASYVKALVSGLQGGIDNPAEKQLIATCKHYAAYDVETGRYSRNYDPTQQDLNEYYLPSFKACVRDAKAGSIMCAYNAVDGIPACANEYLLDEVLRDHWGFEESFNYVASDCDAVANIFDSHHFTDTKAAAAAVALNAGTDVDCGITYASLNESIAQNMTTEATLDRTLSRLYSALFTVGFFDGQLDYGTLSWKDVNLPSSQSLAYTAAVEGMTLLKNDGTLPLRKSYSKVAVIGPWAQASLQMQGNYFGAAPYLHTPLQAFKNYWNQVEFVNGTEIDTNSTLNFNAAVEAAKSADLIIYLGGIDSTIESETMDRESITWPGNQLDLISKLSETGKPLVVIQCGGGQLDDTALVDNDQVNSILWAGYPGQDGGNAILDILIGKKSVAGRLPITQYPASYTSEVSIFDPNLRPNGSSSGHTYKWYTGKPVFPFGHGLHYTNFVSEWVETPRNQYDISSLVHGLDRYNDATPFANVVASVMNVGGQASMASDYVGLLFISTANAGPSPRPNKSLVSYGRLFNIPVHGSQELKLPLTLGSLARADEKGDLVIYPGDYQLAFDIDSQLTFKFKLTGHPVVIEQFPRQASSYNFTVPVHPQK